MEARLALGLALGVNGFGGVFSILAKTASRELSGGFGMTKIFLVASGEFTLPSDWRATLEPHSPSDPLNGVKLKLARANKHVRDVERMVAKFGRSHKIVREMEPDGVHEVVKIRVGKIPRMLPIIIGEVAFQLRSALDQLACALAVLNEESPTEVYFPFAGDRDEFFNKGAQGKIRKLSTAAQKLICRLKPYKGGNNLLWALNRLRIKDVHITLVPLAMRGPKWAGKTVSATVRPGGAVILQYPQTSKKEIVLARCVAGSDIHYNLDPAVGIAFGDVEFLEGENVVGRLRELVNLTEQIVAIFENRFF